MPALLIYGTFMRGQPGHANLGDAEYLEAVRTAARYRLWEVEGSWPALIEDENGVSIAGELYEISPEQLARLVEVEPPGLRRSAVELSDGRLVAAFVGDADMRERGVDVSGHGGWSAYRAAVDHER